ncbi:MAG: hypothetical protein JNK05_18440 [Myxococcales bacterium]|nr:hypothetical protein [Myxococcales bacterium]
MSGQDNGGSQGSGNANNPFEQGQPPREEPSATEELKAGFGHFVSAAKKAVRAAEPLANRAAENVGSTLETLEKAGEQVAADVGREVASIAGKLAEKLRAVAERADPPPQGGAPHDPSRGEQ